MRNPFTAPKLMKHRIAAAWPGTRLTAGLFAAAMLVSAPDATLAGGKKGARPARASSSCAECTQMVPIRPGSFMMGSTDEETASVNIKPEHAQREKPRHKVTIARRFLAARHEVTRGQFKQFVQESGYKTEPGCGYFTGSTWAIGPQLTWENPGFQQADDHPVVCVSWNDAQAYVAWLRQKTGKPYRLPSEAEWEYMARAGTQTGRFWDGNPGEAACRYASVRDIDTMDHYKWNLPEKFACSDGYTATAPVGRKTVRANRFGLVDMLGNVWEWVDDCHHDYAGTPTDGSAWQEQTCEKRLFRGGSYFSSPSYTRATSRDVQIAGLRADNVGFRIVRDVD